MRFVLLLKLAVRNLVRQRRRSALAVAILAAGTMTVLLTRSWQTGMMDMIAREGANMNDATDLSQESIFRVKGPANLADDSFRQHGHGVAPLVSGIGPPLPAPTLH